MAEVHVEPLTMTSIYDAEGRLIAHLAQQDLVAVRVIHETATGDAVTLLIVDRALLERGGVVRVGG